MAGDPLREDEDPRYADDLLSDALDAALRATQAYSGELVDEVYTAESADQATFELPGNVLRVLRVGGIDNASGVQWYTRAQPQEAIYVGSSERYYDVVGQSLTVSPVLEEGDQLRLVMERAWSWPTDAEEEMELPLWVVEALPFYAVYYLLCTYVSRLSVESAWKTRLDSGRPVDNPAKEGADWYLNQFEKRCIRNIRQEVS